MNAAKEIKKTPSTIKTVTIKKYYESLLKSNINVFQDNDDYFWVKYEKYSVVRFPEFNVQQPTTDEIKKVFKELKCYLLNYTIETNDPNNSNSILYNCRDKDYSLEKLSRSVRRNIRLAQRRLRYDFAEWDEILNGGLKAFADTRKRVGLSDGTERNFINRFTQFSKNEAHKFVATWLDEEIIGFMTLIIIDDFVIIQGTFSTDEHRSLRPNNVMVDFVLNYFLVDRNYSNVCYGLSSIQEDTGKEGLHYFKVKVGFDAVPVERVFILHPAIRPFKGAISLLLHLVLLMMPKNRILRKAAGIMDLIKTQKN